MNKKWTPYLIIAILAIILFFVKRCKDDNSTNPKKDVTTNNPKGPSSDVNRNRGFDRRVSYIEYTEHAKCRMQCRKISQAEVEEIMRDGKINYAKSDVNDSPCPTYALEGITKDDQRVRIVFAQCDLKTKVVTSIDLDTNWECHCPGDDAKYKNKN
ncbi:MAG: DUF4258 domain-containing protein [Chitinophagaceae bacterium]